MSAIMPTVNGYTFAADGFGGVMNENSTDVAADEPTM